MPVRRLTFDQLESIQVELLEELVVGRLTMHQYVVGWDTIVDASGWTWDDYAIAVDERWTGTLSLERSSGPTNAMN